MKGDYFVFVGNAYPHKNLERLVKAVAKLNEKQKVVLKISSSRNIFTGRLEKLIKSQNSSKYIELLGYVSDSDLSKLYKNSVAFVFPTLAEGFGLPPLEAIRAGTLAIVSDIPVLKEVYQDSVNYFDPTSIESIAKELEIILKMTAGERKKKILFAQNYIKKYSWLKMAKETLKIYEGNSK